MDASHAPLIAALAVLLVASGAISATETAYFGLTGAERDRLRREHPGAARLIDRLLARPRSLLVTVLLLNNAVNVAFFVLSTILASQASSPALAAAYGLVPFLMLVLFGEVFAKTLASANAPAYALLVVRPLEGVHRLLSPLRVLLDDGAVAPLARLFNPDALGGSMEADELAAVVELAADRGDIDRDEQRLLADVLQLGQLRIRDVMTPRARATMLDPDADPATQERVLRSTSLARLPVVSGHAPWVAGMAPVDASLLAIERARASGAPPPDLSTLTEPMRFVPENARLDALLEHFRSSQSDVLLVADEHGDVVGLITAAQLIEELLAAGGDASSLGEPRLVALGEWVVPGRFPIHECCEAFGIAPPDSPGRAVSTIAGLLQAQLGRMPIRGDRVQLEGLDLIVERVQRRRVEVVRLRLRQPDAGARA